MKQFATLALGAAAVFLSTTAMADPIMINDDEGYSRLARWEKHLDDRIADGVQSRSLSPRRAWEIQKDLDSIEARVLQSYYESNNGIDRESFRTFAGQLRDIGNQLGDQDWAARNVYGNGWYYGDRGRPYPDEGRTYPGGNPRHRLPRRHTTTIAPATMSAAAAPAMLQPARSSARLPEA